MAANRPSSQKGSALIVSLLLLVLLFALGGALLATSRVESTIAANEQWSEGAFFAAEAGIQMAVDRIQNQAGATDAIAETEIGEGFTFRTGSRTDTAPQPVEVVGSTHGAGYSAAAGTGYNSGGFVFNLYDVNVTGQGPRNASRELNVQVEYGPVADTGI